MAGLFQMGQLGWTPAAQLATQNLQAAGATYAAMDKKIERTETTKTTKNGNGIFGDIMGAVGVGLAAYTGLGGEIPKIFAPAAAAASGGKK